MQEHAGMNKHVYLYIYTCIYVYMYVCVLIPYMYLYAVKLSTTFRRERLIVHHVVAIWGPRNLAMFSVLSVRSVFIMSRGSSRSVEPPPYFK